MTGKREDTGIMDATKTPSELADEHEFRQMRELGELMVYRSQINKLADGEWSEEQSFSLGPLKPSLMGEDPRLPAMPEKPSSEGRRGGKEGVRTCRSRWAPSH